MKVTEFVKDYLSAKDQPVFLLKHIMSDVYVSYNEKIVLCENIVRVTSYTNTEPRVFKRNSPAQYMLFMLTLISKYTDIEIDFSNIIEEFDVLNKEGLIAEIIDNIPEREYTEFSNVLKMALDDEYSNNRDLVSFLEPKFEAIATVVNTLIDILSPENLQKLQEKMNEQDTVQ